MVLTLVIAFDSFHTKSKYRTSIDLAFDLSMLYDVIKIERGKNSMIDINM